MTLEQKLEWKKLYHRVIKHFTNKIGNCNFIVKAYIKEDPGRYIPLLLLKEKKVIAVDIVKYCYGDRDLRMMQNFQYIAHEVWFCYTSNYFHKMEKPLIKKYINNGFGIMEFNINSPKIIKHKNPIKLQPEEDYNDYIDHDYLALGSFSKKKLLIDANPRLRTAHHWI